jgi:triosephosphate isomerase
MNKMIILNHKMNLEYDQVYEYISEINKIDTDNNIIVCPSNLYLENFMNNCTWGVGAQNVFDKPQGNYTGEISTLQLKSLGVEYCIVGHYERRKYFAENNKKINRKLNACLDSNIMPIVCFGSNGTREQIEQDLDEILDNIDHIDFIVFAYEPLELKEFPGTSKIEDDINYIYDYLYTKYNSRPNIIYGGGIKKDNIKQVLKIENLSGILIGQVSEDINKIKNILKIID